MSRAISIIHHPDRRTDVVMPYAPGIVVRRGQLVFLSGLTAAAVYHSHPHRDEEFDLPSSMREQATLAMENLKKTLEAAGCDLGDLVAVTRYLTDLSEQDDLNRVWGTYLGGHLPTTTTVQVAGLATHPRCKLEITAIAVAGRRGRAMDVEASSRRAAKSSVTRRNPRRPGSRRRPSRRGER